MYCQDCSKFQHSSANKLLSPNIFVKYKTKGSKFMLEQLTIIIILVKYVQMDISIFCDYKETKFPLIKLFVSLVH